MPQSALTTKLIADGLKPARPMRCIPEILAEHRDLVAFAVAVRGCACGLRLAGDAGDGGAAGQAVRGAGG